MNPTDPPNPNEPYASAVNLYEVFRDRAQRHPGREFLVHRSARYTWRQALEAVDRCAAGLTASGVRSGDRVAILSPTRPEASFLFLACAKLAAIYLGLGTRLQRSDMDYVCADAQPTLLFAMPDPGLGDRTNDLALASEKHGLSEPIMLSFSADGTLAPEFAAFLARTDLDSSGVQPASPTTGDFDEHTPLAIVYTSGSTGSPKGVVLSHRSLLNYRALLRRNPLGAPRLLSAMPIDHVGHLGNELTAAVLSGGTLIQVPRFEAREVLYAIERERVTVWMGAIPTMLNRLVALDEFGACDLSSLELVWWAGQLPERTALAIAEWSDEVGASYGMSEMACITLTDPGESPHHAVTTVGRPLDDVEVRIDRSDDELSGEVLLRRVGMMSEYWQNPGATAKAIDSDGWFHTGDLGYLDAHGRLVLTGRLKLLIRSGGYNLSPFEIETTLESHPDIGMAVVVGIQDPEYGEAAHVAWVPIHGADPSEADLRLHLRERLSGFKVPKHFHRFDVLPLLANGKADRVGIRKQLVGAIQTRLGKDATDAL